MPDVGIIHFLSIVRKLHSPVNIPMYSVSLIIYCSFSRLYFQFHPGKNVGLGKDHTIFSLIDGLVKFEKFGTDRKKVLVLLLTACIYAVHQCD